MLQVEDWIGVLHLHIGRNGDRSRRIAENPAHAGGYQAVRDPLGGGGRHSQHGHANLAAADLLLQQRHVLDGQRADPLADLVGIALEGECNPKATIDEAAVVGDRPAQVPDADQGDVPDLFDLQNPTQLGDQEGNTVAGSLLAEFSELREILADLRRRDSELRSQLLRGGDLYACLAHARQGPQVVRQATDDDVWHFPFDHAKLSTSARVDRQTLAHSLGACNRNRGHKLGYNPTGPFPNKVNCVSG